MIPVKTNESNFVYLGPTPQIADLHCRVEGTETYSVWLPSDEDRRIIAECGVVRLGIHGVRPIPPVSLQVVRAVGPYEQVHSLCDVCGKPLQDEIHNGAPSDHAFRSRNK